jgi:DNA-binding NarL/FixJ family response regulator
MENQVVIIVDDHKLFREGIELLLNQFDFISEIHHACNGKSYLELVKKVKPNLVLMDINMPEMNGIEATKNSKEKYPEIKIIALTMHEKFDYYAQMTEAGVDGFITKDTNSNELKLALKTVLQNESYFSQSVLKNVIANFQLNTEPKEKVVFSKREKEILSEMAKGLSNIEISEKLFISHRTVERHKENMFKKTECKNGIHLVIFAIKNGIIEV